MTLMRTLQRGRLRARYAWAQSGSPWWVRAHSLVDTRVRPFVTVLSTAGAGAPSIGYAGVRHGTVWIADVLEQRREAAGAPTTARTVDTVRRSSVLRGPGLPDADLVAVGCAADQVARLPRRAALVLPFRMHMLVDLSGPEGAWRRGVSRRERQWFNSRSRDGRLGFDVAGDDDAFDAFYHRMHVPTMRLRHGDRARSEAAVSAYENLFRSGVLGFATVDGERVAGVLCRRDGDLLTVRLLGVLDGAEERHADGGLKVLYHLLLDWADRAGFRAVDFGAVEPWLSQGIFQWKRRFGPRLGLAPNHSARLRVWWHVRRDTPAVRDYLVANPVYEITEDGALRAVYFHDDDRPPRLDLSHACANNDAFRSVHLDEFLAGAGAVPTPARATQRSAA